MCFWSVGPFFYKTPAAFQRESSVCVECYFPSEHPPTPGLNTALYLFQAVELISDAVSWTHFAELGTCYLIFSSLQ